MYAFEKLLVSLLMVYNGHTNRTYHTDQHLPCVDCLHSCCALRIFLHSCHSHPQAVLDGPGHLPLVLEPSTEDARRGPGAYFGPESGGGVGTEGPAWDFSRYRMRSTVIYN